MSGAAGGRDRGRGLDMVAALMDDLEVLHTDDGTQVRMRRRLAAPARPAQLVEQA